MSAYNLEMPDGPFTTIVADPPWTYEDELPGSGRGAAKHYDCMSLEKIIDMRRLLIGGLFCAGCGCDLKVGEHGCVNARGDFAPVRHISGILTNTAHLYLWAPNAFVHDAWGVAEAWGFEPKTILTWVKVTNCAGDRIADFLSLGYAGESWRALNTRGIVRIGMGRSFRNCTEHVIVATRGKLDFLRKDVPNVFFAPRQAHSQKPAIFYDIVESMSPGRYLELFARQKRPGWVYPQERKGNDKR